MKLVSQINEGLHKGREGEDEGGMVPSLLKGWRVRCEMLVWCNDALEVQIALLTILLKIRYNLPSDSIMNVVQCQHYNQSINVHTITNFETSLKLSGIWLLAGKALNRQVREV